jgi:hypothetical protein
MIVLMVEKQDCIAAVNVDGARAERITKTFQISNPELEKFLVNNSSYQNSRIIGFELLDDPPKQ